jgi:hypothetical protein
MLLYSAKKNFSMENFALEIRHVPGFTPPAILLAYTRAAYNIIRSVYKMEHLFALVDAPG